eukprot:2354779-Rhodomonas_salina.1
MIIGEWGWQTQAGSMSEEGPRSAGARVQRALRGTGTLGAGRGVERAWMVAESAKEHADAHLSVHREAHRVSPIRALL